MDQPEQIAPFLPYIFGALSVVCLFFSLRSCRKKRLIQTLPTSKVQGVFVGLVELHGTAESTAPLTSYLTGISSIYYSYLVEEEWSKLVTVTEKNADGEWVTRTRRETGWTMVAQHTENQPFYLQDDTGSILVQPQAAQIEPVLVFDQVCTPASALYYEKGPAYNIIDTTMRRRFHEYAISLHAPLFIVGHARERQDVIAPEIAANPQAEMFLISTRNEQQITRGYTAKFWGLGVLGLLCVLTGPALRNSILNQINDPYFLGALGSAYFFLWFITWMIVVFNSIVSLRQKVRQGWAQVEVQLKRRADLIPNLIQVVQSYRDYEQSTQTLLTSLRSQLNATNPGQPGADYSSCAPQVIALAESYPELKANQTFLSLQESLSDTEQRIALARSYFNDIATFYNTRLESIPDVWIASLGTFSRESIMQANGFERAEVKVKLE